MGHENVDYVRADYRAVPHKCVYRYVKRSSQVKPNGQTLWERCKCGRRVFVDSTYIVEGRKSPLVVKHWYDKDGNLEKTTGDK